MRLSFVAVALLVSMGCVWAGDAAWMLSGSGLIVPLAPAEVAVQSAQVVLTLPGPGEYDVQVRAEYRLINQGAAPLRLRVAVPSFGGIAGFEFPSPAREAIINLDGKGVAYTQRDYAHMVRPIFEEWRARGWELLGQLDPEMKSLVQAFQDQGGGTQTEKMQRLRAYFNAHHDPASLGGYGVSDLVWFLVGDEHFDSGRMPGDVPYAEGVMHFLDPTHDRSQYDLARSLGERWGFPPSFALDPYDGRLCLPIYEWKPVARGPHQALETEVTLEPGRTHTLVFFYRQFRGYDEAHRPGEERSQQYCVVLTGMHKWAKWDETIVTVRSPLGMERLAFCPDFHEGYRQEEGYQVKQSRMRGDVDAFYLAWIPRADRTKPKAHNPQLAQ